MKIYPALDLIGGRAVRLTRGDYATAVEYPAAPLELAQRYAKAGAAALHLVDLEAARDGCARHGTLVAQIADQAGLPVQYAGGVRSAADIERHLATGCERVVAGSIAGRKPTTFGAWLGRFGPARLVAALDVRQDGGEYRPALDGWTRLGTWPLWTLVERLSAAGLKHLLCTAIERDGTLGGPDLGLYRALVRAAPQLEIQASGGIATLDDLKALRDTGVAAAVIGKALLDGVFTLAEARQAVT